MISAFQRNAEIIQIPFRLIGRRSSRMLPARRRRRVRGPAVLTRRDPDLSGE
jgi:hypothetical protein